MFKPRGGQSFLHAFSRELELGRGRESREKTSKGIALGHQKGQVTIGKVEEVGERESKKWQTGSTGRTQGEVC